MSMWRLRWHLTNKFVTGAPHKIKVTICHTAGLYGEENDDWNSAVFRSRRNRSSDGAERTDNGSDHELLMQLVNEYLRPWRCVVGVTLPTFFDCFCGFFSASSSITSLILYLHSTSSHRSDQHRTPCTPLSPECLTQNTRDVTKFEFEFDNVRTTDVFNRFEILRML